MGQKGSKNHVGEGVRLYNALRFDAALESWHKALERSDAAREKFLILGYLVTASFDRGRYRDMLAYAAKQIDIAHEVDDVDLRAEAYLNLARSNEHLGEYHNALTYSRHSLSNESSDPCLEGYAFLCLAHAYRGLSDFRLAIQFYDKSMKVARHHKEMLLESQVNTGYGYLFLLLRDFEKALFYQLRAAELARGLDSCDIPAKFTRLAALSLSIPNRKLGRFRESMELCEESMKVALSHGDRAIQAKCLCVFADIHRRRGQIQRAQPRYESALGIMFDTGDQYGQGEVLAGMTKAALDTQNTLRALDLNKRALGIAEATGCRLQEMQCHMRFEAIYSLIGDADNMHIHTAASQKLFDELHLICILCRKSLSEQPSKLDVLSCGHVMHTSCFKSFTRTHGMTSRLTNKNCPSCQQPRTS